MTTRLIASVALAATVLAALPAPVRAQPAGPGPDGMRQDMMMGPGMMGRGMTHRMCSPNAAGFAEWRIQRLERLVNPTEAQRAKFDEFKAASGKAVEIMRSACPNEIPLTAVGRMAAMEKRMEAMLQAVKTVRPALEGFYGALSDEQKARLDSMSGGRRFMRWRDRW
jgi:hypothetical protein